MTHSFTAVELFCGAGGLSTGLRAAGFAVQAAYKFNPLAAAAMQANHPDVNVHTADVRQVDFRTHAGVTLVSGGPPCQPFSVGGAHTGQEDPRDMFPQAIRAVREIRPAAFLFENVRGLLRAEFAAYLEYVQLQLAAPQVLRGDGESRAAHAARLRRPGGAPPNRYVVTGALLDTADYGVPQTRERYFLVGLRADLNVTWTPPAPTHSAAALAHARLHGHYQARHGLPFGRAPATLFDLPPTLAAHVTVRDVLASLTGPDPQDRPGGARAYPGHTGSPPDLPAKTIKAGGNGVPGGENMYVSNDGQCHYFTNREAAAIQGFPPGYVFCGARSDVMRQIGNAVPPLLARAVARSVHAALKGAQCSSLASAAGAGGRLRSSRSAAASS